MTHVRDAELFTVGPRDVVVTFTTDDDAHAVKTVVGDREIVTRGPHHLVAVGGLEPATSYALRVDGVDPDDALLPATFTTLPEPRGPRLATFATVNDVHFGETVCGLMGIENEVGPIFAVDEGDEPYPEVMNRAVIDDMLAIEPDAVLVKGDLTDAGTAEEYAAFLRAYGRFGSRLHHVRGNHDAMTTDTIAADAPFTVELAGVTLAVLDTVRPGTDKGRLSGAQLEWLDALAAGATQPVLVFGHHHPWDPASADRNESYFGINPDDSEALCAVIARRDAIAGYFAGHTHRSRVRRFASARHVPIVEIACVKDYPGAWARYDVHEGGYVQTVRRASSPRALDWTERTRHMFADLYADYARGTLADRCFVQTF
jgi:3',5'-cyclic-AMP phosphodiesterase